MCLFPLSISCHCCSLLFFVLSCGHFFNRNKAAKLGSKPNNQRTLSLLRTVKRECAINRPIYSIDRTKKTFRYSIVFWRSIVDDICASNFNFIFSDIFALCKCRLSTLHKPFNWIKFFTSVTLFPVFALAS